METNPNAMLSVNSGTMFTNVGLTPDNDIWWEGIGSQCPNGTITWTNDIYNGEKDKVVAHPNARFAAPAANCPAIDPAWEDPKGVPISAILFGGRRPSTVPLVFETKSWNHGVFVGSVVGSEVTAAAIGLKAGVRRDPFAMLPFCRYNMGDYFQHWINMGEKAEDKTKLPKIFNVNWFRKDNDGKWLWPGFGDNIRVLEWIFNRCEGKVDAVPSAIGNLPKAEDINLSGIEEVASSMPELLKVDKDEWLAELELINEHYAKFGDRLPSALKAEHETLKANLA